MSASPFARTAKSIPVTVVAAGELPARGAGTALIHLDPALHDHAPGTECVACAAAGDVRAMLFDVLTEARQEQRALDAVIIDARDITDVAPVLAKLDSATAAIGLRDHTVLRSFHLSGVI